MTTKFGNNPAVLSQIFQIAADRLSESLYDNKTAVTNHCYFYEEIKIRSNSGNACYHSVQNIVSYGLQSIKKRKNRSKCKDANKQEL
jgi:chaperonin GroEL (HSP60 family)